MPEGLSAVEAGNKISEHAEHEAEGRSRDRRDRRLSIAEAVVLSVVTLVAAWAGYSAAKWGTESSLKLAKASATRVKANRAGTSVYAMELIGMQWEYAGREPLGLCTAASRMTLEQAIAYGHATGNCVVCGAPLSDPKSVERGIGPVCAKKFA